MGLDMYAYVAAKAGQQKEYWDNVEYDREKGCYVHQSESCSQPIEIAYWRKHPNLHGWMYNLWVSKGNSGDFNGDELELTIIDLDMLQLAVETATLPPTSGFFFGNGADEHYRGSDLEFITKAREAINSGLLVFYNSSW
jgi:hypothetical protein